MASFLARLAAVVAVRLLSDIPKPPRIATERAAGGSMTVAMTTDSIATARQVFCLFAYNLVLFTQETAVEQLCSHQERWPPPSEFF